MNPIEHLYSPQWSGYACTAMIINMFSTVPVSPRGLHDRFNYLDANGFLSTRSVIDMLSQSGLECQYVRNADIHWWDNALKASVPAIALCDYRKFNHNPHGSKFAQYVIPYLHTNGGFMVYDPMVERSPVLVLREEFVDAISSPSFTKHGDNMPYQAIMVEYGKF